MNKLASIGPRPARIGLTILDAFLGVTAVLGGLGLLSGVAPLSPPLALLEGSPFASYLIPGLALLILLGGGGLLATMLMLRRSPWGVAVSGLIGAMVVVFEAVELIVIGFTGLLAFYVGLGLAILALSAWLWLATRSASTAPMSRHQAA